MWTKGGARAGNPGVYPQNFEWPVCVINMPTLSFTHLSEGVSINMIMSHGASYIS